MSQLLLTRSHTIAHGIHKRSFAPRFEVGSYFLMFSMILVAGLMSFLYLMQFTDIHTKGYSLRRLETEQYVLKNAQESKYTNISRVRSLSHIQETDQVRRMIPAGNPIYLKPDTALVLQGQAQNRGGFN